MDRRWAWILAAAAALAPGGAALADGCHFPERAIPAPPRIPAQRALIVHRDGVELLVVESSLDAAGQSFGWILPVPARPTEVGVATAGALDLLDLQTGPKVVHDPWDLDEEGAAILIWLLLVLGSTRLVVNARDSGSRVLRLLVWVFAFFLVPAVIVPNLLSAKLGVSAGPSAVTEITPTRRIGSYDVTVLAAKEPGALDGWLEGRGFTPVPAAGRAIVAEYIREGWVFVAARLAREGGGTSAPHPLSVTFPAREPVYPMRLTALSGGATALRLHVVAAGGASAPGTEVRFRGAFGGPRRQSDWPDALYFLSEEAVGGRRLGHPQLVAALWDGCVVTRLEGTLDAAAMGRDLALSIGPAVPFVPTVYSLRGAVRTALAWVFPWFCLPAVLLAFFPPSRLPFRGRRFPYLRCLGILVGAAGVATLCILPFLPTIPVMALVPGRSRAGPYYLARDVSVRGSYREGRRDLGQELWSVSTPTAEIRRGVEEFFRVRRMDRNPYTGLPFRDDDSPGNFQIVGEGEDRNLRFWDEFGCPVEFPLGFADGAAASVDALFARLQSRERVLLAIEEDDRMAVEDKDRARGLARDREGGGPVAEAEVLVGTGLHAAWGGHGVRAAWCMDRLLDDGAYDHLARRSEALDRLAWGMARLPAPRWDAGTWEAAVRGATKATRLRPEEGPVLGTLGAALYRAGRYDEAVVTLRRADAMNGGKRIPDVAFLAMALHRLGKAEEARTELERLKPLMAGPDASGNPDSVALFAEAQAVLGEPAGSGKQR